MTVTYDAVYREELRGAGGVRARGKGPIRRLAPALLALIAFLSMPVRARACSQCLCGSPTPPDYLLGNVDTRLGYGLEERYLAKKNALEDVAGEERQAEHRLGGMILYRPTGRLSLQGRLPYVFKTNTEAAEGEPEVITHSHGLGDAAVLARFDAFEFRPGVGRRATLALVAGSTLPTGSNDARDDAGERLDAHLQPGTGAWSWTLGAAADAAFPKSAISANVLGRWNGSNARGYRYGDAFLFNAGYARTLATAWQAAFELNGRTARRDRTEEGADDENSGGTVLYAAPSVQWSGLAPLDVTLLVQVPVAQSLNGNQDERTTARLALVWRGR